MMRKPEIVVHKKHLRKVKSGQRSEIKQAKARTQENQAGKARLSKQVEARSEDKEVVGACC